MRRCRRTAFWLGGKKVFWKLEEVVERVVEGLKVGVKECFEWVVKLKFDLVLFRWMSWMALYLCKWC